jgi:hypothetical protein
MIMAVNEDSFVFGEKCLAKDLRCEMKFSTIIWFNNSILHCGIRPIIYDEKALHVRNDIILIKNKTGLLQIQGSKIFDDCNGLTAFKTT